MAISAKVSSLAQPVGLSTERTIGSTLQLTEGSNVALNVHPDAIASYSRDGNDLVIRMADGETLNITNFYAEGQPPSQLYLVGTDDELLLVELGPVTSEGYMTVSYTPQEVAADFESLTATGAATESGGLGNTGMLVAGGLAIAGGVAAASGGGGGGGGGESAQPPPPASAVAPSNLRLNSTGTTITGRAEPGSTVELDIDGDGVANYTALVGPGGLFTINVLQALQNGEQLQLRTRLTSGTRSDPATLMAPDDIAPLRASSLQVSTDGSQVSGRAEPGSTVSIDTNGDGTLDASVLVGPDGQFVIPLTPPLDNGETISVVVRDAAGNSSQSATLTAPDTTPPPAPVVYSTNGQVLTGTAEIGANVVIVVIGNTAVTVPVDATGNWSYTPVSPIPNGTTVTVTARDDAGNTSPPVSVGVTNIPSPPVIVTANASLLSGTAVPNSSILITDSVGNPFGIAAVGPDGNWMISLGPLPSEIVLRLTTHNPQGQSAPVFITLDNVPPAVTVTTYTANTLEGIAEAGSTVNVSVGGTTVAQVVTDANGKWTVVFSPALADGVNVQVTARDVAGNTSAPQSVQIDAQPPAAPVVTASSETALSGTAEPGSLVRLVDDAGRTLAELNIGPNGTWSFTPSQPLAEGTEVTITARDTAGNTSSSTTIRIDTTAPDAPVVTPSNGTVFNGTAEPGSTVTITGPGGAVGQTTADANGDWQITPTTPLPDGAQVSVITTDRAGNPSTPVPVIVDLTPPPPPVILPSNGSSLSGTAEPGSTITISTGGAPITVTADADGNWSVPVSPALADGTVVSATATDAAGNVSGPSSHTTIDGSLPDRPQIYLSNGSVISGTATAGDSVVLTDGNGNPIATVNVDVGGTWSYAPATPLPNGTRVIAVARDGTGDLSAPVSVVVDSVPPAAPVVNPSNGTLLAGSAEAGASVLISGPGVNAVVQAGPDGRWTFSGPGLPLADGTQVSVSARDATGNTSTTTTVTIDAAPPPAPAIAASTGTLLTGTAEIGTQVILSTVPGGQLAIVSTDANGKWSYSLISPLPHGTQVTAVTKDALGNTSGNSSTFIDAAPPAAPVISPSNGSVISGTGEIGATIILTNASGAVIGTTTVLPNGSWSFTPDPALPDGARVNATATDAVGNLGPASSTRVDGIAPPAPVMELSNGTSLRGTAEPNSTVRLVDGDNNLIGTAITDGFGNWTFPVAPTLPDGTVVNAVTIDAAGNTSQPANTTTDGAIPNPAIISVRSGSEIAGTAEPDSTVLLALPGGATVRVPVDGDGNWSFSFNPPMQNNQTVNVSVQDAAGNTSTPQALVIDALPPPPPSIDLSNGAQLQGTTEVGSVILITLGNDAPIVVTPVPDGSWSYTPTPPLAEGDTVTVEARDANGNVSTPVNLIIDTTPPSVTLEPSNGSTLAGITEAGARVAISVDGTVVDTVTADVNGHWTWSPAPGPNLPHDSAISVVARDAAGNSSTAATGTIDSQVPTVSIQPSNGTTLSGITEGLAVVTITSGGVLVATVNADAQGNWSYTPGTPLAHNAPVTVIARDAAGNTSTSASTTVDREVPPAPTINPGNGSVVTGEAEPNSTITLTLTAPGGAVTTVGPIPVNGSGDWTYTPTPALPNGTTLSATTSDAVGNTSPASAGSVVDSVPPPSPSVLLSNGTVINGTAEAGSIIRLEVDGVTLGTPPLTVTADANGYWRLPGVSLPDGAVIEAWATDAAGNSSLLPGTATVDTALPPPPVINPSRGNIITGTAEPGTMVTLTIDGQTFSGIPVNGAGNWSHFPNPTPGNGAQVTAVAVAGANTSSAATMVIDAMPPPVPDAQTASATTVTGTGEIGSTILVRLGATVLGSTTVGADGKWTVTLNSVQPDGTLLTATAQDALGNSSTFDVIRVDANPPSQPAIRPTNGTLITGTAESNGTVLISVGGVQIGTAQVDGGGNWSFNANPPLADGVTIDVVARDPMGNASPPASITVDGTPPPAPVVNVSNGLTLAGTAEIGSKVIFFVGGVQVGTAPLDGSGNWTFSPSPRLPHGTQVEVRAQDAAGNLGAGTQITVDGLPPAAPVIDPDIGATISGTAEPGSTVTVVNQNNQVVGSAIVNGSGVWSFVPVLTPAHGDTLSATATDAAGNASTVATVTVDLLAPLMPTGQISADGTLLSGVAEANSTVTIVLPGGLPPIQVQADGSGNFSVPLSPALTAGQTVNIIATDAASNDSPAGQAQAPNLTPPTIGVAEAADGYVNAAEASNGIQVQVGLQPGTRAGDSITLTFRGQGGFTFTHTHVVTGTEIANGAFTATLTPPGGNGTYPQGTSTVTAHINSGADATPINFVVDTIPPATPVLSLVGSLLTISGDPGVAVTVSVNIGGVTATQTLVANNAGIASLNLLTGLNIGLTWDQLLSAQIGVSARDAAGNPSNVAQVGLGVGTNLQPVTVGNFAVDASLNPLEGKLGFTGTTLANASLIIEVISPLLNVTLSPIIANASGQFSLNLLSPSVLSQLGLSADGLLNLGADLQLRITSTAQGKQSASYTVDLDPLGLLGLTIGTVTVTGSALDDILSGTAAVAERIVAGNGNDLIVNVGSGDRVEAGTGNDTIQITASNFASIDGGSGFDTLVFTGGIDINFNSIPLGTITNIERIDLGAGDSGSTITLTAAQVDAMTDGGNTLQITGESNDILQVNGAVFQNTQTIDGIRYQVFQLGNTTLQVEENTVQVIV